MTTELVQTMPKTETLSQDEVLQRKRRQKLEAVARLTSFYRENPHRFAKDYLNLDLRMFQQTLINMMEDNTHFMYLASRAQGKTFLVAVYCVIRCILYPGTTICVASGTKGQSSEIINKIKDQLMPQSANLCKEIEEIMNNAVHSHCKFYNKSMIKVVAANDNARSNRANIIVIDEFRLVSPEIINKVLRRFLAVPRMPGYLSKPEYKGLVEREKEIYMSSCWYQSHWSYEKAKAYLNNMLDSRYKYFVCGLPYQLSIQENLLQMAAVEEEMSEADFSATSFMMEMECKWYGDTEGSLYSYEEISKNRVNSLPMMPTSDTFKVPDKKFGIKPKSPQEKRIISVDVALMGSQTKDNDASSIIVNQILQTKNNRYMSNIVYAENREDIRTEVLALEIRKLFDIFDCDYLVLDVNGLGIGVYDAISTDMYDADTGIIYPAISCINKEEFADRCTDPFAPKVIYAVQGSAKFNSECALTLREGFRQGYIHLLIHEYEAEELLRTEIRGYDSLESMEKTRLLMPYINTSLIVQELVNLQYEIHDETVRVREKSGCRKDRYSSLSYNYWCVKQLEQELRQQNSSTKTSKMEFLFRKPKIK